MAKSQEYLQEKILNELKRANDLKEAELQLACVAASELSSLRRMQQRQRR